MALSCQNWTPSIPDEERFGAPLTLAVRYSLAPRSSCKLFGGFGYACAACHGYANILSAQPLKLFLSKVQPLSRLQAVILNGWLMLYPKYLLSNALSQHALLASMILLLFTLVLGIAHSCIRSLILVVRRCFMAEAERRRNTRALLGASVPLLPYGQQWSHQAAQPPTRIFGLCWRHKDTDPSSIRGRYQTPPFLESCIFQLFLSVICVVFGHSFTA